MLTAFRLLWRRRRWRHGQPALRRPLAWLAAMVVMFVAAMAVFEDMGPGDSLWLAVVTLTTVGYGDVFAKTGPGRIATALLLLAGGVFVVAKLASDWFEWREEVRARKRGGAWRWGMEGHVLVIGTPEGAAERFFLGLLRQLRGTPAWRDAPVMLLTRAFAGRAEGLPAVLCAEDLVHVEGAPTDEDALRMADAPRAAAVVVLAERTDDAVSCGRCAPIPRCWPARWSRRGRSGCSRTSSPPKGTSCSAWSCRAPGAGAGPRSRRC